MTAEDQNALLYLAIALVVGRVALWFALRNKFDDDPFGFGDLRHPLSRGLFVVLMGLLWPLIVVILAGIGVLYVLGLQPKPRKRPLTTDEAIEQAEAALDELKGVPRKPTPPKSRILRG